MENNLYNTENQKKDNITATVTNKYYIKRFNTVLEYIHLNLDKSLNIRTLAEVAFISEFHFHRLIKSFLGESLGAYIKRIRIETGAKLLKYSDCSITEIAYKVGYNTQASFNKSFRNYFNESPGQFRKNSVISLDILKINKKQKTNFDITVNKRTINDIMILCYPTKGELGSKNMNFIWNKLISYCTDNNLITNKSKYIGMQWDDPSITKIENIRYDACISINENITSPYPVKKIAGGGYLCFRYRGDTIFLGDVYDQIFRDHIIKNSIKLKNQPLFEEYVTKGKHLPHEERITDIFVPVG